MPLEYSAHGEYIHHRSMRVHTCTRSSVHIQMKLAANFFPVQITVARVRTPACFHMPAPSQPTPCYLLEAGGVSCVSQSQVAHGGNNLFLSVWFVPQPLYLLPPPQTCISHACEGRRSLARPVKDFPCLCVCLIIGRCLFFRRIALLCLFHVNICACHVSA